MMHGRRQERQKWQGRQPRRAAIRQIRPALTALTALIAVTALLQSCGGEHGRSAPTITDSAGVTIVEYAAWAPESLPWSVGGEPLVQIGALEGEDAYQFDQIGGVGRLSDGSIVVANGGTQELRYFDRTGRHLRTTGRKGEGPGEFQALGLLVVLPGDTVAVYDWNQRRISYFDAAGTFARSISFQYPAGVPFPAGRFADGGWLSQPGFVFAPGSPGTDVVRDTSRLLVFDEDGKLRDSTSRWIGPDFYIRSEGNSAFATSLPFGRSTELGVWDDRYYAGYTDRYEIVRRTEAGAPDLVIRAQRPAVPVTDAAVAAHKAERLERTDAQFRPQMERLYQDIPFPPTMPAFSDLQVDADGNLWVLEVTLPGDERRRWTVFDTTGRMLGSIETPPAVSLREIGRDYLLGTWTDDLEVQYVRLYRLDRGVGR